jgi:C4-dicarboxylate-specific signal transduction histidine kinase
MCCLNGLVREVAEFVHGELVEQNIELLPVLEPALPKVEAARVEVQQVIVNLVLNAVQAMKDTPRKWRVIHIETCAENGLVTASVRDGGRGIPVDRLATIFNPFYTTKSTGLGMGLAICRRIIEAHGGRIEARNQDAGGAVFSFSLPVADPPRRT